MVVEPRRWSSTSSPPSPVSLELLPGDAGGDLQLHYFVRNLVDPRDSGVNQMLGDGRDRRIPEASEDLHRSIARVEREPGRDTLSNRCLSACFESEPQVGSALLRLTLRQSGTIHERTRRLEVR